MAISSSMPRRSSATCSTRARSRWCPTRSALSTRRSSSRVIQPTSNSLFLIEFLTINNVCVVDASEAGTGQLEISVENGRIPCQFVNQGNLRFVPSFIPREAGPHQVNVRFNTHEVPGSPFVCEVVDVNKVTLLRSSSANTSSTASVDGSSSGSGAPSLSFGIGKKSWLELALNGLSSASINLKLTSPSGAQLPVSRSTGDNNNSNSNSNTLLKLDFQLNEIGTHVLDVDYAGVVITGSPFDIKAYDATRILVSDIQSSGEVNKPCEVLIDASSAGEGQLEIAVNEGLVKNQVKQIKPGNYAVSFVPTKTESYTLDVKFNQENAPSRFFVFFNDHLIFADFNC